MGKLLLNVATIWFLYAVLMVFMEPTGNGWTTDFGFHLGSVARFCLSLGGLLF